MIKQRMHPLAIFFLLLLVSTQPARAEVSLGGGDFGGGGAGGSYGDNLTSEYKEKYKGANTGGSMCTNKTQNKIEAKNLVKTSIDVNLDDFKDNIVSRVEDWGHRTATAISDLSGIETFNFEMMKTEIVDAMDKVLKIEQIRMIDQKTLEATRAMKPTDVETKIASGLSLYRSELPVAFRQSEMQRYISELNNVPLPNKFRNNMGQPLPGYVDTSSSQITAMGQEFRNFVRYFCDLRSLNGRLASTKFEEYNGPGNVAEYWCGQSRGLAEPPVTKDKDGKYIPLTGTALMTHVTNETNSESALATRQGGGLIELVNAPKNVSELYFEPRSLTVKNQDVYEKAEQEFARMVIGRAADTKILSDLGTGSGQRDFMNTQARVAKLALARYPFAEMFSQKVPSMPVGSAQWAADMIEANMGGCKSPNDDYKQLCNLTKQLRMKSQISESEFFDVLFSRQFQGMAFNTSLVKMSEGQMKRLQTNLLGLQLALNYKRNRLKEQQLALMAAIYAQQSR